jgi:hypothetical protein
MTDEKPPDEPEATVLVFRNSDGDPVAVPAEIVELNEKVYRAYQEHLRGADWEGVAEQEGYPSASAAAADVRRYLATGAALLVEHHQRESLQMEVARLDALQYALWPAAMRGHVQSAMGVMNIILNRAKLKGLDPDKLANNADTAQTVIIPGDPEGYGRALRAAAGEDPA